MTEHYEYKGYLGSAEVDVESRVLVGRLLYIRDTIAYSASTPEGLETAFREAVDEYLENCAEEGDEPDVPLKGSFNVRVGPERHRKVAIAARRADVGLNEFVCAALDVALCELPSQFHVATAGPVDFAIVDGGTPDLVQVGRGTQTHDVVVTASTRSQWGHLRVAK